MEALMNHLRREIKETLIFVLLLFIVFACGTTPKQKQLMAIDTFNSMYKQYLDNYDRQSPEMQAQLKEVVDPLWKTASDAIKVYAKIQDPTSPTAVEQASIYTTALNSALSLLVQYGIEIKEE